MAVSMLSPGIKSDFEEYAAVELDHADRLAKRIQQLAGTFLFQSKTTPPKFAFAPTPTVVPTPQEYRKIDPATDETASWNEFSDKKLQYAIKHPKNIMLDKRQPSEGRLTVFIFDEDKTATLPGKVTAFVTHSNRFAPRPLSNSPRASRRFG